MWYYDIEYSSIIVAYVLIFSCLHHMFEMILRGTFDMKIKEATISRGILSSESFELIEKISILFEQTSKENQENGV